MSSLCSFWHLFIALKENSSRTLVHSADRELSLSLLTALLAWLAVTSRVDRSAWWVPTSGSRALIAALKLRSKEAQRCAALPPCRNPKKCKCNCKWKAVSNICPLLHDLVSCREVRVDGLWSGEAVFAGTSITFGCSWPLSKFWCCTLSAGEGFTCSWEFLRLRKFGLLNILQHSGNGIQQLFQGAAGDIAD